MQNAINPQQIDWTITIDTQAVHATGVYLVDLLSADQQYAGTVSVKKDSMAPDTITLPASVPSATPIADLTLADCKTDMETRAATLYRQTSGEYGFAIPLGDFGGTAHDTSTSSRYEIKYSTKVITTNYQSDVTTAKDVEITNDAKMVYDHLCTGNAPGTDVTPVISSSKDLTVSLAPLTQKSSYTPETQELVWSFDINRYGAAYNYVIIEDLIPAGTQFNTIADDTVTVEAYSRATGERVSANDVVLTKASAKPEMTATSASTANVYFIDEATRTIYYGIQGIAADCFYNIKLSTKVVDAAFLRAETDKTYNNQATITMKGAGSTDPLPAYTTPEAAQTATNMLLTTECNGYDYSAHTSSWTIKVNPNNVPISALCATDKIPKGTSFKSIDSITKIAADGRSNTVFDTPNTSAKGSADKVEWEYATPPNTQDRTIKFSFTDTDNTLAYTITLTLSTDESFRRSDMGKSINVPLKNTVSVTGNALGVQGGDISLDKDATCNVNYKRVTKSGEFTRSTGKINWISFVNVDKIDLAGTTLIEDLALAGMSKYLELDPDSIRVWEASTAADGTRIKSETELTSAFAGALTDVTFNGFKLAIPDDYARSPFAVTFDTDVIKNGNFVYNKLYFDTASTEPAEITASGNIWIGNFNYDNFCAAASQSPKLTIIKKDSANGVLQNAEFEMSYAAGGKTYTKVRESSASGKATFLDVPCDTVLTVREKTAPADYALSSEVLYFVYLKNTERAAYSALPNYNKITFVTETSPETAASHERVVTNIKLADVVVRPIELIKTYGETDLLTMDEAARNALLGDTEFGLYTTADCEVATQTASPQWKGSDMAVVTFDGLQADTTYYVKEIAAPSGYIPSEDVYECRVYADGKVGYRLAADTVAAFSDERMTCDNENAPTPPTVDNTPTVYPVTEGEGETWSPGSAEGLPSPPTAPSAAS